MFYIINYQMIKDREEFARCLNKFNKLWVGVEVWVDRGVHWKMLLDWYKWQVLFVDPRRKLEWWDSDINNRNYDYMLKTTLKNIKWGNALILRWTSEEVSKMILDESLDFVYIDAQHSYEWCMEDINYRFPKVRKGWVVSGHDYYNAKKGDPIGNTNKKVVEDFGVKDAVDDFAREHNYSVRKIQTWGNWYFIK